MIILHSKPANPENSIPISIYLSAANRRLQTFQLALQHELSLSLSPSGPRSVMGILLLLYYFHGAQTEQRRIHIMAAGDAHGTAASTALTPAGAAASLAWEWKSSSSSFSSSTSTTIVGMLIIFWSKFSFVEKIVQKGKQLLICRLHFPIILSWLLYSLTCSYSIHVPQR